MQVLIIIKEKAEGKEVSLLLFVFFNISDIHITNQYLFKLNYLLCFRFDLFL